MKRFFIVIAVVALLAWLASLYVIPAKQGATMIKDAVETGNSQIDDARKSVDDLNKSTDATKKALEQATGR